MKMGYKARDVGKSSLLSSLSSAVHKIEIITVVQRGSQVVRKIAPNICSFECHIWPELQSSELVSPNITYISLGR